MGLTGRTSGVSIGQEFKAFLMRGNVVDLAIAVVLGTAFGAVVTAFVEQLIMPLIAVIGGQPNFDSVGFNINDTRFGVGVFLTAVVSFVIIAAVVFFFVVKPMNTLSMRSNRQAPADPTLRNCPACLSNVPIAATRCAFCTSELQPPQAHELVAPG